MSNLLEELTKRLSYVFYKINLSWWLFALSNGLSKPRGLCFERLVQPALQIFEVFQGRVDGERLFDACGHGFESLVTVAGDADHHRFVFRNAPALDELLGDSDFSSSRRFGKNALRASQ